MSLIDRIAGELQQAWSDSRVLTATSLFMLVALAVFAIGIISDSTIISGAPAWMKPAKFAASTAIFLGTLAWIYRFISVWPRFMRALAWLFSAVLVVEVAIVAVQAARRTTSHFNVATPLDGALFSVMGLAILVLWLALLGVGAALFRQEFSDPAWGWWLRLAVLVTVLGSASGGIMLSPTAQQSEALRSGGAVTTVGAHTSGGPDGGPGLWGVGWSTEHGDLRIPHFLGLHGFQILPLLGWLSLRRRRTGTNPESVKVAFVATAGYLGLFGILTWQALRGQSVIAPDIVTVWALAIWLLATLGAIGLSSVRVRRTPASTQSGATR